jgi:hypothetical protein
LQSAHANCSANRFTSLDQNSEPMTFLKLANVAFQLVIGRRCGET